MRVQSLTKKGNHSSVLSDLFEPWNEWFQNGILGKELTVPAVNIAENSKEYKLSLAAPGLSKEDFEVTTSGNLLTISAEKEKNTEEKEKGFTRQEYNYSSFSRCFTLPDEVNAEGVLASYENGVLKITLPKNEKAAKANTKSVQVN